MLVRLQNPTCGFYATERDWDDRFGRNLKEDARPMLILAPMQSGLPSTAFVSNGFVQQ